MSPLANFIQIVFNILIFLIVVRSLLSWVRISSHHPLVHFLEEVTDPILHLAKKITPNTGMIDFSPTIAVFALVIIENVLLSFFS